MKYTEEILVKEWGFSKTSRLKYIVYIFNILDGTGSTIKGKILEIDKDLYFHQILPIEQIHLTKPFYKYKNKKFNNIRLIERKVNSPQIPKHYGIYGIYENDELVYIGYTTREFESRWQEHIEAIMLQKNMQYVHKQINPNSKIEFGILIDITELKTNKILTTSDIQSMELALIYLYQPKYNVQGVTTRYSYSSK